MVEAVQRNHLTKYDEQTVKDIAYTVQECSGIFGFLTSVLWAQILHETGRFRYGGQVKPHQYNFAGLGATNDGAQGATFRTVREGVLAVCAHRALYQYGDVDDWPQHLQKFGHHAIRREAVYNAGYLGVCTVVGDFTNGRWAWSPQYPRHSLANGYAYALVRIANEVHSYSTGLPMTAQVPGFKWEPADSDHYEKGRRARVRGGAQHYTNGTNSLPWLTKTSQPAVSAHFLIKNRPTMSDRGWQLVRLEDTAWTTAYANSYTVSIEYELRLGHTVTEEAYRVMAQTWIDIANKVKELNLGEITLDADGIKPHRDWVGNPSLICSDGVDVNRILHYIREIQGEEPVHKTDDYEKFVTGHWIVNDYSQDPPVELYSFFKEKGGVEHLGLPLTGMWQDEDGVYHQVLENVVLEFWPNGFGYIKGPFYRFGRYLDHVGRIGK